MFAVPAATPLTTPRLFTLAVPAALLLHIPPALVLPKAVADPIHTFSEPLIGAGNGLTFTTAVRWQPVGSM
jgi:hypothetical protein